MRTIRLLHLFALALALASCGPSTADIQSTIDASVAGTVTTIEQSTAQAATAVAAEVCGAAAKTRYADAIDEQIQTFVMQAGLASNTPRGSIGPALQGLLDIQTETRRIEAPQCLTAYHERVINMMGLHRAAYENFAAQGSEAVTTAALRMAGDALVEVQQGLATIRSGAIPPTVTPVP